MQFQLSLTNILLLILCIKIVSADRCNELCGLNCGAFTTCEVDVFVCSCKANVGEIVGLIVGIIAALIIACVSKTENKFQAFVTILITILKITEVQLLNIIFVPCCGLTGNMLLLLFTSTINCSNNNSATATSSISQFAQFHYCSCIY